MKSKYKENIENKDFYRLEKICNRTSNSAIIADTTKLTDTVYLLQPIGITVNKQLR